MGLANPTVAEKQDLDLRVDPLASLEVIIVRADFIQDVLTVFLAADFRGQIIQLAAEQTEFFQGEEQGFKWCEPAETRIQAERL